MQLTEQEKIDVNDLSIAFENAESDDETIRIILENTDIEMCVRLAWEKTGRDINEYLWLRDQYRLEDYNE